MTRSYETLVNPDTHVDVKTGVVAAEKLQTLIDSQTNELSMLELKAQVRQIIDAVRSTVPESMWPDILAMLPGGDRAPDLVRDDDDYGDGDELFDPLIDGNDMPDFVEDGRRVLIAQICDRPGLPSVRRRHAVILSIMAPARGAASFRTELISALYSSGGGSGSRQARTFTTTFACMVITC